MKRGVQALVEVMTLSMNSKQRVQYAVLPVSTGKKLLLLFMTEA